MRKALLGVIALFFAAVTFKGCNLGHTPKPYPKVIIHGYVEDSLTGLPIGDAFVVLSSNEDTTTLNSDYTNANGYYSFDVCFYFDSFPISAFKSGYDSSTKYISTDTEDTVITHFKLQPIQKFTPK